MYASSKEKITLDPLTATGNIAAVILAAGASSRMGSSKPLLPFGAGTALERVVATVRHAGVRNIVVVTGHREEEVAPVVERLGARAVYNPAYDTGMFSSVLAGVRALSDGTEAFFVSPVDCPLVRPEVLRRLIAARAEGAGGGADTAPAIPAGGLGLGILYPVCCGKRGHPPLISGRYRAELLHAGAAAGSSDRSDVPAPTLAGFLEKHGQDEAEVEVDDLTILMDMDTPEDYNRLRRLTGVLDAAPLSAGQGSSHPSLGSDDCLYLLSLLDAAPELVTHSRMVAQLAVAFAQALRTKAPGLDVELLRAAGLLHDIAKRTRKHAAVGQRLLENLGLRRVGEVMGAHMVIGPDQLASGLPTEEQLLYLADKMVHHERVVGVEERTAQALEKYHDDPEMLQGVETRLGAAQAIADKVEALLGRPLFTETRIYLVRHGMPDVPDDPWRFLGQSDPPLNDAGIAQAEALAERLKGVRFEAAYSSDLRRAVQTAEILVKAGHITVQRVPELREIDMGLWDMLTRDQVKTRYPEAYAEHEKDLVGSPFPGGESFRELERRVGPAFARIMDSGPGNVLVVAHKAVNRVLLTHLLGMPLEEIFSIPQEYCCVHIVRVINLPDGSRQVSVESLPVEDTTPEETPRPPQKGAPDG